jgi:hypothetical protein
LDRINNPAVDIDLSGKRPKEYVERLYRLHKPVGGASFWLQSNRSAQSPGEARREYDANAKMTLSLKSDQSTVRALNRNLPIMRRVLIENAPTEKRKKALRAFFDSFYVYEYGRDREPEVGHRVFQMNKTMFQRYERLLRATNRILVGQNKAPLF